MVTPCEHHGFRPVVYFFKELNETARKGSFAYCLIHKQLEESGI